MPELVDRKAECFVRRLQAEGFYVLAFDFRRLGQSGGHPRQVVRLRDQIADWGAALDCAAALPEVRPTGLAAWDPRSREGRSSASPPAPGWPP